jgi:hypothetical protein
MSVDTADAADTATDRFEDEIVAVPRRPDRRSSRGNDGRLRA